MQDLFSRFDLDQKETDAFLELVRLGASPISVWAKHTGNNRSSMYVLLERLKNTGLVSVFTHKGIQYAQAIPISDLPSIISKRQEFLADTQTILKERLPKLQNLEKSNPITPKVKFYEGKARVELMYEEVLEERSFKAFFHPERVKTMMPEYFHKIPQTLKARGGRARELLVFTSEGREYQKLYQSAKHQIRFLPKGVTFSSDTIITKQKMYLVGYSPADIAATEIWNEALAQTQSVLFDLVWDKTNT